jgi:hypothetical protein
MSEELTKQIREMYQRIRRDEPMAAEERELMVAVVGWNLRTSVGKLAQARINLQTLQLTLFYHWLHIAALSRFITEDAFTLLAADLEGVAGTVIRRLKGLEAELRDDGRDAMPQLGASLQLTKDMLQDTPRDASSLPRAEVVRQAERANHEIWLVVSEFLLQHIDPLLIESGLFYNWLRTSTVHANLPEGFFLKMERHWLVVMKEVGRLVDQFVCAADAVAAPHGPKH